MEDVRKLTFDPALLGVYLSCKTYQEFLNWYAKNYGRYSDGITELNLILKKMIGRAL